MINDGEERGKSEEEESPNVPMVVDLTPISLRQITQQARKIRGINGDKKQI